MIHPSMSKAAYDVVIVGAGIVGAACADEFARRGSAGRGRRPRTLSEAAQRRQEWDTLLSWMIPKPSLP